MIKNFTFIINDYEDYEIPFMKLFEFKKIEMLTLRPPPGGEICGET